MKTLYGHNQYVTAWVSSYLDFVNFGPNAVAIGVVNDTNDLVAGIVYNKYQCDQQGRPLFIEGSIASIDKSWAKRHILYEIFRYPFIHLGVKRLQATTARSNKNTRDFLQRLGFTFEGFGREAWHLGGDAAVYSMLKHECKWIKDEQGR